MGYKTMDGRLQWRSEELPLCFFCGWPLSEHDNNKQGHPWRRSSRVTVEDLNYADDVTRELHQRDGLGKEGSR